jgi:hypothetical protein
VDFVIFRLHGSKDTLVAVVLINKLQLSCTFTIFQRPLVWRRRYHQHCIGRRWRTSGARAARW